MLEREAEASLLEHGEWHAELTRQARDGSVVQVASHWILHRDQAGRPDAVIEVDNDVTEQRRAQELLRRGEARYRALVVATARIVWTTSADGTRPLDLSQWIALHRPDRVRGGRRRLAPRHPPRGSDGDGDGRGARRCGTGGRCCSSTGSVATTASTGTWRCAPSP